MLITNDRFDEFSPRVGVPSGERAATFRIHDVVSDPAKVLRVESYQLEGDVFDFHGFSR